VWFFVDVDGRVKKTQISKSSGHAALDEAAIKVANILRFSPAVKGSEKVATWVELPIAFGDVPLPARTRPTAPDLGSSPDPGNALTPLEPLRAGAQTREVRIVQERVAPPEVGVRITEADFSVRRATDTAAAAAAQRRSLEERPVFTPMTVRPQLTNTEEVSRALVRSYPPLLRDAGIGGTPTVWFYINAEGTVVKTVLSKSSGHAELDEAALAVASIMKFSPALNRDQKVAVWVEIPIVYRVN
jgi:protein TonB